MSKQRPGAHIWKAWADGKTVQFKYRMHKVDGTESVWLDDDPRNWGTPDAQPERWRVKPAVKSLSVKFAVCELDFAGNICFDSATNETKAKYIEEKSSFIKWITDWINVDVEVDDDGQ